MGRFINADAFASTGQGLLGNNMFAYCLNNPAMGYDPTGEFPWIPLLIGAGVGAGLGALATWVMGGTGKDVFWSGVRGAAFGGISAVAPGTTPYIISIDAIWTTIEMWGKGVSFEKGVLAGLVKVLSSGSFTHTGNQLTDFILDVTFGAGKELTVSGIIELIEHTGDNSPYAASTDIPPLPSMGAVGGSPQNTKSLFC